MGRPPKRGLDYFPKDTSYYSDFKIMELLDEYGPIGQTIYDIILCMVYRDGYYLEIDPNKLAMKVVRVIGNKWVKKDFVLQVICSCADIGLLHDALLRQGIITSAGLQRRYANVTVRNKIHKEKYWLLDENLEEKIFEKQEKDTRALLSVPFNQVSVTENPIPVTETLISATEMTTKEKESKQKRRKENKTKSNLLLSSAPKKVSELKEVSELNKVHDSNRMPDLNNAVELAEYCGIEITPYIAQSLIQLCNQYSDEWVCEAIKQSADNAKKNLGYVKGILKNWEIGGKIERNGNQKPAEKETGEFDDL